MSQSCIRKWEAVLGGLIRGEDIRENQIRSGKQGRKKMSGNLHISAEEVRSIKGKFKGTESNGLKRRSLLLIHIKQHPSCFSNDLI